MLIFIIIEFIIMLYTYVYTYNKLENFFILIRLTRNMNNINYTL
jgi:hypothetical protein